MSTAVDLPVARAYQEELAARALSQNAILAMDTGTGKTLISVMVLRSKLAAARMKVAQGHRMVRIFKSKSYRSYQTHFLGRSVHRPTCPIGKPTGEFYSPDDHPGRWRIPWGQGRRFMESRELGEGVLLH